MNKEENNTTIHIICPDCGLEVEQEVWNKWGCPHCEIKEGIFAQYELHEESI